MFQSKIQSCLPETRFKQSFQSRQPRPMSRAKSLLRHLLCRNIDNKGNDFHGFIPVTANAVAVPVLAHVVISGIQHGFHTVICYQGLPFQNIIPFKLPMMLMYPNGCTRLKHNTSKGPARTIGLLLCHEGVEGHIPHPLLQLMPGHGLHLVFSSNHDSCPPVIPYSYPYCTILSLVRQRPAPFAGASLKCVLHLLADMPYGCRQE